MQKIVYISSHKYSVKASFYFLHCHGYVSFSRINLSRYKTQLHFCASVGKFMVKTELENMELFSIPALVSTFDMFDCVSFLWNPISDPKG